MGGSSSKLKKYSAQDRFRRRWNYEGDANTITPTTFEVPNMETGNMETPFYQTQGEPDEYINFCESDQIDNDSVWLPQRTHAYMYLSSGDNLTNVDDELYVDMSEVVIRETVLDGPDDIYEEPDKTADDDNEDTDLYSISTDSSETKIKQLADKDGTTHAKKYLEFDPSDRQQRRLHRYEEMVIIFEPLIVQNVIARHLIPHLTFLEDPGKIQAIADRNPRSAVLYIIDELKNNHTETGRWKQFIEALERCEYRYIVSILRGEKPVDHSYQREYLRIITPVLRIDISPIELTEVLWSADVISEEDKEEIHQMHTNCGLLAATDRLLDRVPRKHRYWYSHLIDGLRRINMAHAADMLDIPELRKLSGDYIDDFDDDYIEPMKRQPTQIKARTGSDLHPSKHKVNDSKTLLHTERRETEDNLESYEDVQLTYIKKCEDITEVPKRPHSTHKIRENDRYVRKMPPMSAHEAPKVDNVKSFDEYELYEELPTTNECAPYSLPPPPDIQLSLEAYPFGDDGMTDNSPCNTLTDILTQEDGQTAIPYQANSHGTLPPSSRYNNTAIEDEMENILPPPVPKQTNRKPHSQTTRKKLSLPSTQTCREHNEGRIDSLNTNATTLFKPLPKSQRMLLRASSLSDDTEEEYPSFEVVVLQYPPKEIDVSPPFPEPGFSNQTRSIPKPPSKPLGKQPVPLPRRKLSTDNRKIDEGQNKSLGDIYYDDAYTVMEDTKSLHEIDEFEEDANESEEIKSDDNKTIKRKKVLFEASKEHDIANRRARGNKLGISRPPSQKKKMRRKRMAQSRKKIGGNLFRNLFQRKKVDKQSHADEEEITSEKETCAVQLNKKRPGKSRRSKSLPIEINKAIESMDLYYSQPFRVERRKPETTSLTSAVVDHKPVKRAPNSVTQVKETLLNIDKNKVLTEIFNTCRKRHGIDQEGIKSEIIVREFLQENIHPDVKALLEDVEQQTEELTVLVHQEPVLKMKVEIQTNINEKLKHKRLLKEQFDLKAKEASALKAAIANPCDQFNGEPYCPGMTQTYDSQVSSARQMTIQETFEEKPGGKFSEEPDVRFPEKPGVICAEKHDVTLTVIDEDEHIVNKADEDIYNKDSAFYSYSVRL